MRNALRRSTLRWGAGVVLPLLLAAFARWGPLSFQAWEEQLRDSFFAAPRQTPALRTVCVVGFDDKTMSRFEWKAKLDHRVHAKLVRRLFAAGARAVAFDFAFLNPSTEDPSQHAVFADACRETGKVVLGTILGDEGEGKVVFREPLPVLRDAASGLGVLYHPLDTDSVIRRTTLLFRSGEERRASLALQAWLSAEGLPLAACRRDERGIEVSLGGSTQRIPVDEDGNLLIWYAGPAGTIPTHSYVDVLDGKVGEDELRGRVVFVGPTARILQDVWRVPSRSHATGEASSMYGVEIHGHSFLTLAEGLGPGGRFLLPLERSWVLGVMVGLGLLTAMGSSLVDIRLSWLVPLLLVPLYLVLGHHFLFLGMRRLPPFLGPVAAIAVTYLFVVIHRYLEERRQRAHVRSMFAHFVPAHVVGQLEQDPSRLQAPGRKRRLTVLMSDIRGFTPLAERLGAERTVEVLNRYFEAMTEAILAENGMIDKFIGDAVLAVFGEPVDTGNHAAQGVRASLSMRRALARLNADPAFRALLDSDAPLDNGVALNTGEMIVGNLGAARRKDYTVIGDAVNLCARLEGLAKGRIPASSSPGPPTRPATWSSTCAPWARST